MDHQALKAGVEAMGLQFVVDEAHRLPQLNAVTIPAGVDEAAVRTAKGRVSSVAIFSLLYGMNFDVRILRITATLRYRQRPFTAQLGKPL